MKKLKILGYFDLSNAELKKIAGVSIFNKNGYQSFDTQTKTVAKKAAKKYSELNREKRKVYKVILEEVK